MESGLKALWVLSVVLLVSNWQHWTYGKPQVPCYFVFGDSLFDNGNNNYLNTPAKVNYLPYGIDFDTGASGRCSNGLNIADTIAEQLGFDSYISDFGVGSCTSFLDGVNYGSNGAGILDLTGYLAVIADHMPLITKSLFGDILAIEIKRRIRMKVHKPKELYFYIYICEVSYVNMVAYLSLTHSSFFPLYITN